MNKKVFLLLLLLCPLSLLRGQDASFYTSLLPEIGYTYDIKKTMDQKLICLIRGPGSNTNYLVKLDTTGNILWQRELDYFYDQIPLLLTQTTDSCFIIICRVNLIGHQSNLLIRTDPEGNLLWSKCYNPNNSNNFWDITSADHSEFTIIGDGCSGQNLVIRFDSAGSILWSYQYRNDSRVRTYAQRMLACEGGNLLIAGYQYDSVQQFQYPEMYLLDSNANTLWHNIYSANGHFTPTDIIRSHDHGYTLCGMVRPDLTAYFSAFMIHFDAWGNVEWAKQYWHPYPTYPQSLVQLADSSYIISGSLYHPDDTNNQIFYIKTSVDGDLLWGRSGGRYSGSELGSDEAYCSLWLNGNYFYTGGSSDGAVVIKSDGDGKGMCLQHAETFTESTITFVQSSCDFSKTSAYFFSDTLGVVVKPSFLIPEFPCTSGIENISRQEKTMVQPNPFSQETLIRFKEPLVNAELELINMQGQTLRHIEGISGDCYVLQRGKLPEGCYILKIGGAQNPCLILRIAIID